MSSLATWCRGVEDGADELQQGTGQRLRVAEDGFWTLVVPDYIRKTKLTGNPLQKLYHKVFNVTLNVPTAKEAIPFAFEMCPSYLYHENGNCLPFGCHAWQKQEPGFWKPFIEQFGYDLSAR